MVVVVNSGFFSQSLGKTTKTRILYLAISMMMMVVNFSLFLITLWPLN